MVCLTRSALAKADRKTGAAAMVTQRTGNAGVIVPNSPGIWNIVRMEVVQMSIVAIAIE
jgi:hypothetical protein